jgi:hypothetical protein
VARKADWEEEQAKEKARNPDVRVRKNWSPRENSLMSFFETHRSSLERSLLPAMRIRW